MIYKFDHKKMITLFLASMKRRNIRVRWLVPLLSYLNIIDSEFNLHLNSLKSEMKWNGQKIILERLLQLSFGSGITIENHNLSAKPLIVGESGSESNPVLKASPDYTNPVLGSSGKAYSFVGFTVSIPSHITYDESAVRALVDYYLIGRSSYVIKQE